jgi:hypothetical protein
MQKIPRVSEPVSGSLEIYYQGSKVVSTGPGYQVLVYSNRTYIIGRFPIISGSLDLYYQGLEVVSTGTVYQMLVYRTRKS